MMSLSVLNISVIYYYIYHAAWSRTAETFKMEHLVIIVKDGKRVTIIKKISILDVAAALDLPQKKKMKSYREKFLLENEQLLLSIKQWSKKVFTINLNIYKLLWINIYKKTNLVIFGLVFGISGFAMPRWHRT